MEGCLLCLEISKDILDSIPINSAQWHELDIRKLIEKHLWPIENMNSYSWLCNVCWQELQNFHNFYQRIEEAHMDFGKLLKTDDVKPKHKLILDSETYNEPETCYLEPEIIMDQNLTQTLTMQEEKLLIKEEPQEHFDTDIMMTKRKRISKDFMNEQELLNEDPLEKSKKHKTVKKHPKTKKIKSTKNVITSTETITKDEEEQFDIKQDPDLSVIKREPSITLESFPDNDDDEDDYGSNSDSNYEPDEDCAECTEEISQKNSYYKPRTNRKEQDKIIAETFKEILCDLCQFPMINFSVVHKHFTKKHNAQKGYVSCCRRKFFSRTRLVDHIDYHKNPDQFKCKQCGRELADSIRLKLHMLHVHGEGGEIIKRHSCDICGKSFAEPFKLRNHKLTHLSQEEKKFPCSECGKFYASTYNLNYHIQAVHQKKFVKICHICGKTIGTSTEYKAHMEKHEGKPAPSISCDICGLRLTSERGLKRHKEAQHPEGGKKDHCCPICPKVSPTVKALKKHIHTMHEKGHEHKCTICEKAFKRSEALKEHMAAHTGTALYTCPWCPKTFNSNGNMHSHRKKMHPREWEEAQFEKYSGNLPPQFRNSVATKDGRVHLRSYEKICDICGKRLRCGEAFQRHILEHEGKSLPSVSCDICGLVASSKHNLRRHINMQPPVDGKKEYICNICFKVSPNIYALRKHVNCTHRKDNIHKCTVCARGFKRPIALREHMATHTGIALYTCPWCPKTFNASGGMHAHRKSQHPVEWEESRRQKNLEKCRTLSVTKNNNVNCTDFGVDIKNVDVNVNTILNF